MVKHLRYIYIFILLTPISGQIKNESINPCKSKVVQKAKESGLRSLKLAEKIQYYRDLKKCQNKGLAKAIKKEVNSKQLNDDANSAKTFVGKTSTFAYCVMALILYMAFA